MTTWETPLEQLRLIIPPLIVTGTGTTFGVTGGGHTEAQVGDIIHFGFRQETGATDAAGICYLFWFCCYRWCCKHYSQLTIGSTAGLTNSCGTSIAATTYH